MGGSSERADPEAAGLGQQKRLNRPLMLSACHSVCTQRHWSVLKRHAFPMDRTKGLWFGSRWQQKKNYKRGVFSCSLRCCNSGTKNEFVPLDSLIFFPVSTPFFLEICVRSKPPPQTALCPRFTPPTWTSYQEHLSRDLPDHVEINCCNHFDKSALPHGDARVLGDSRHRKGKHGPLTLRLLLAHGMHKTSHFPHTVSFIL